MAKNSPRDIEVKAFATHQVITQRIGLRDHVVGGKGFDLNVSGAVLGHDACLDG